MRAPLPVPFVLGRKGRDLEDNDNGPGNDAQAVADVSPWVEIGRRTTRVGLSTDKPTGRGAWRS